LTEDRASCDFPLLGQTDIFYERVADYQVDQIGYVPRAEDPVLVQVRQPKDTGTLGAIFFLNTISHPVQRSYSMADLGINNSVFLYSWEQQSRSEQAMKKITLTLAGHHSALYFFSSEPIREIPVHLPS
jgi:hypothetical protein